MGGFCLCSHPKALGKVQSLSLPYSFTMTLPPGCPLPRSMYVAYSLLKLTMAMLCPSRASFPFGEAFSVKWKKWHY